MSCHVQYLAWHGDDARYVIQNLTVYIMHVLMFFQFSRNTNLLIFFGVFSGEVCVCSYLILLGATLLR